MIKKEVLKPTDDLLVNIYKAAGCFSNGIYVRVKHHPCGWDFISFEEIAIINKFDKNMSILTYTFALEDISGGIYDYHIFQGYTLREILEQTNGKFEFEIGNIR